MGRTDRAGVRVRPALATSHPLPRLGVVFDGGGGANGLVNSMYLNLRSAGDRNITLAGP